MSVLTVIRVMLCRKKILSSAGACLPQVASGLSLPVWVPDKNAEDEPPRYEGW